MKTSRFLLSYILSFGYFSQIGAMDRYPKDIFQNCRSIKAIKPDESDAEYDKIVQSLRKNNLSTCICLKYFHELKEQKAFDAIDKEFDVSKEAWKNGSELFSIWREDPEDRVNVEITDDVAKDIAEQAKNKFIQHRICGKHQITTPAESVKHLVMGSTIILDIKKETKEIKKVGYAFFINKLNELFSPLALEGAFLHEFFHIIDKHIEKAAALRFAISVFNNQPWRIKNDESLKYLIRSSSFKRFQRFTESAADRLPAACNTSDQAKALEAFFKEFAKFADPNDTDHAVVSKRLAWATRIRKLKEAEERLSTAS